MQTSSFNFHLPKPIKRKKECFQPIKHAQAYFNIKPIVYVNIKPKLRKKGKANLVRYM